MVICFRCQVNISQYECEICNGFYCSECDKFIHSKKPKNNHIRKPLKNLNNSTTEKIQIENKNNNNDNNLLENYNRFTQEEEKK